MTLSEAGAVSGAPRIWLRLEDAAVLALSVSLYWHSGHSWALFAAAFLVPDLVLVAYLAGPRVGAVCYNAVHSYLGPALLGIAATVTGHLPAFSLVWAAHLALDRVVGYGLKYSSGFADTHLGKLRGGRPSVAVREVA